MAVTCVASPLATRVIVVALEVPLAVARRLAGHLRCSGFAGILVAVGQSWNACAAAGQNTPTSIHRAETRVITCTGKLGRRLLETSTAAFETTRRISHQNQGCRHDNGTEHCQNLPQSMGLLLRQWRPHFRPGKDEKRSYQPIEDAKKNERFNYPN